MAMSFWIEKAWGDSVDNVTMQDIRVAIQETIAMDDEHGAFWVGDDEGEYALEVHKNLQIFYNHGHDPDDQRRAIMQTWDEVENLYRLFITGEYEKVEDKIKSNSK